MLTLLFIANIKFILLLVSSLRRLFSLLWRARLYTYFILLFPLYSPPIKAWQHEIAVGFGKSKEIDEEHTNSGVAVYGKLLKLPKIDDTLYPSIDLTFAEIQASTFEHDHLCTVATSLACRAYFAKPEQHLVKPYVQISFGPAYLSHRQLATCLQGKNFAFQSALEAGMEVDCQSQGIELNIRLIHYCNAGIFSPNNGIDLMPVISIGYLF
jgi:hypothetical protein